MREEIGLNFSEFIKIWWLYKTYKEYMLPFTEFNRNIARKSSMDYTSK